jgi:predicted RNA-binding protein with PIN domain
MAFLIDGFNLMYKFPDLEALLYEDRLNEARSGLLAILKRFSKIANKPVSVVFDGKKEPSLTITRERFSSIDVFYSLDYSADYLIKQFIKKDNNPRMTTVVTSDKDIIGFVTKFKAKVMKSEEFAEHVNRVFREWEESRVQEKDPDPVLSDDEIGFWENMFRKKKK